MERYDHDVYAYLYVGPNAEADAGEVWQRANEAKIEHCSIWRTTTPARDRWLIVVADQSDDREARRLDFGAGTEYELTEREALTFLERRFALALDGMAQGEEHVRQVIRFGRRGATLQRGGRLKSRVGGDQ